MLLYVIAEAETSACSCPRARQRLRLRGQSPRMQQGTLELWSGLLRHREDRHLPQGAFSSSCLLPRRATFNSLFLPSGRLGAAPTSPFLTRQWLEAETERRRRNSNRRHEMQRAPSHCPSAWSCDSIAALELPFWFVVMMIMMLVLVVVVMEMVLVMVLGTVMVTVRATVMVMVVVTVIVMVMVSVMVMSLNSPQQPE